MSRSFSGELAENQGSDGHERDMDHPMNEYDPQDSNDFGVDEFDDGDDYADWVSDQESSSSVKPTVDRTNVQPEIEVDGPIRCNEDVAMPIDQQNNLNPKAVVDGLIRMNESDTIRKIIKDRFVSGLNDYGVNAQIEHIDRNLFKSSVITLAKLQTFLIYEKAVKAKNGGHANVRHACFGASKDEISKIIAHGFSHENIEKDGAFGYGLYLATDNSPIESVKSSTVDDEGMRHVMYCRVILGKCEAVTPGSKQWHPSSDEYQTGVDSLESPRKVIVWSTQMNTHVLPEFVISFKTLSCGYNGPEIEKVHLDLPIPLPMLIKAVVTELSKILPPEDTMKINEHHRNYVENKISRHDMFVGLKDLAGARLLVMVIKDLNEQQKLLKGKQGDGLQDQSTSRQVNT